jgi:alginate O-acetyltransferase complex protein AlgI
LFSIPTIPGSNLLWLTLFFIIVMIIAEWFQREKNHGLQIEQNNRNQLPQLAIYYIIIFTIIIFGSTAENEFIYFKF